MSFRGKLTERFADVPKMRPDLVKIGIIKDGFVYGSLVVDGKRCFICISAFVGNQSYVNNAYATMFEVDPETVGQFTGYCDESQHNAFEGDILSYRSGLNYGVIKYGRYSSPFSIGQDIGFYVEWVSDRGRNIHRKDLGYWLSAGTAEIVGNIHDNPELLGEPMKPASKDIAQSGLAPATENFELLEG